MTQSNAWHSPHERCHLPDKAAYAHTTVHTRSGSLWAHGVRGQFPSAPSVCVTCAPGESCACTSAKGACIGARCVDNLEGGGPPLHPLAAHRVCCSARAYPPQNEQTSRTPTDARADVAGRVSLSEDGSLRVGTLRRTRSCNSRVAAPGPTAGESEGDSPRPLSGRRAEPLRDADGATPCPPCRTKVRQGAQRAAAGAAAGGRPQRDTDRQVIDRHWAGRIARPWPALVGLTRENSAPCQGRGPPGAFQIRKPPSSAHSAYTIYLSVCELS